MSERVDFAAEVVELQQWRWQEDKRGPARVGGDWLVEKQWSTQITIATPIRNSTTGKKTDQKVRNKGGRKYQIINMHV